MPGQESAHRGSEARQKIWPGIIPGHYKAILS